MVVVAFVAHAIVLFALPRLQFLFSPDVMDLMRYGGHGARVAMNHPILFAVYLLPFPAFLGMYLMQAWGRYLLLAYVMLTVIGSFFFGTSISGPPETFFAEIATLVDGALLGFAFLSPPSTHAQPSNTTPHTDARDVPPPASDSAARAGGRER
jgi:hypothetical protein